MKINGNLSWEKFMKTAVQMNSFDYEQFNYRCKSTGKVCELATEFGYCKVTVCIKKDDSSKDGAWPEWKTQVLGIQPQEE